MRRILIAAALVLCGGLAGSCGGGGGADAGADGDTDTDAEADGGADAGGDTDVDSDADGDCAGADDAILGGSCLDFQGAVCVEWSVDNADGLDEAIAAWEATCVGASGTWATAPCAADGAIGVCEDTLASKVVTVYFPECGMTAEQIEANLCSGECQSFTVP